VQVPGAAFVPPNTRLRQALTRAAVHRVTEIGWAGNDYRPLGALVDERAIVNAAVGLLATGGSTNHAIHLPAIARAAGVLFDWADLDALSSAVPLIARVYPNGSGDVNDFQAAGGMAFVVGELLDAGLLHDLPTVWPGGLRAYAEEPRLHEDGDRTHGSTHPREGGGPGAGRSPRWGSPAQLRLSELDPHLRGGG
jgi:phosphogluconate dehydratase